VVPDTEITKAPPKKTSSRKAKLTFESDQAAATFECQLDKGAFAACSSPYKKKVVPGKHKLLVRAVLGDQTDPTPATAKWKVEEPQK
jgi:hypothetical protein